MSISADIQRLEPGAKVDLYILDLTPLDGEIYYFHPYDHGPIAFNGREFNPWPFRAEGFEMTSGQQPTPKVTVGNVGGFITSLCVFFHDLCGAKLTRIRTLEHYLASDQSEQLVPDEWFIEQKMAETSEAVEFQLKSALDTEGQVLPKRQILANTCCWLSIGGYRGPYCNYVGPPVADEFDKPTDDATKDKCGGLVRSCKLRFGEFNELNYGSFPAAGLIQ